MNHVTWATSGNVPEAREGKRMILDRVWFVKGFFNLLTVYHAAHTIFMTTIMLMASMAMIVTFLVALSCLQTLPTIVASPPLRADVLWTKHFTGYWQQQNSHNPYYELTVMMTEQEYLSGCSEVWRLWSLATLTKSIVKNAKMKKMPLCFLLQRLTQNASDSS